MSQFLEVIESLDPTGEEIVHRVPETGSGELKFGAQVIVRESQAAVFFRDGKALDVLGPGRHTLSTLNLPILTKILSLPWGFTSPFRAEVYFVNQRVFTNLRWGTKDPVAFKDRELGLIRLRAFGVFTLRVTQPLLFVNTLVGTRGTLETGHVEDYLREVIVSRLTDFLGEHLESVLGLPRIYEEMGVAVRTRLVEDFRKYGLELVDLMVSRITPPEDVQTMIDAASGMAAVGDVDRFLKYQAARTIGDLGGGGGGPDGGSGPAAGAASTMGLGAGLGLMIPGILLKALGGGAPTIRCPDCHGPAPTDSRFCAHCGHQMVVIRKCPRCDKNLAAQARFCSACGLDLSTELRCAKCQTTLPPGTRFCFSCGEALAAAPPPPA